MLGFSGDDVEGAFPIKGERQYAAANGPIWIRIEKASSSAIPNDVFAKGCLGSETSLRDCNVRKHSTSAGYPYMRLMLGAF